MMASQSFYLASLMLERALANPNWTAATEQRGSYQDLEKVAVILDVDETILDNGPFQEKLIVEDTQYDSDEWDDWVGLGRAPRLSGAVSFVRRAEKLGVSIFYVTNREHKRWKETNENLRMKGFPVSEDGANLLSKYKQPDWDSDKTPRREFVARTHRILLLIGDDLNDFVSGPRTPDPSDPDPAYLQRRKVAEMHRNMWGTKWIVLPNPTYGSWERALYKVGAECRNPADDEVRKACRKEKLRQKYLHLEGH